MAVTALIISLVAAVLAAVAYWRSGGDADVRRAQDEIRRDLDALRAKQRELVDHAADRLAAAYNRSRSQLHTVQTRIGDLGHHAAEGLQDQLHRTSEHAKRLLDSLEHAAERAKDLTVTGARNVEQGIARRARRIHARVVLLEVKAKAALASRAAGDERFEAADEHLADASRLLAETRAILDDDEVIAEELTAMKAKLLDAAEAVRTRAEDTRRRIDAVVADTDKVVGDLEVAEDHAHHNPERVG
jgi:ElaB/YqjD/DUF883 family membrane-anchored ribosome-binding protein